MQEYELKEGKGRKANQRMQHFLVLQYLLEHSDEDHHVSTERLVDYLKNVCGIYSERRSIYKDIREINIVYVMIQEQVSYEEAVEMLEEDPDEMETVKYKKKSGYFVAHRPIDPERARLIAECVYTSRFITEANRKSIVKGIESFLSEHQRENINHEAFAVAKVRTNNSKLFENIDTIHAAMATRKEGKSHAPEKIRFKYLKYTIQNQSQQVERRHGDDYVVSPHAIIINEGNYYLLGINEKHKLLTYRIDRMSKVRLTGEIRESNRDTDNLKEYLSTYSQRVFSMYGGERERVRIRFTNDLLDTIVDRFNDYASYFAEDNRHFTVSVTVEISPTFFGWLCGFGNKAKLLSPSPVIEKFTKHIEKIQVLYQPR